MSSDLINGNIEYKHLNYEEFCGSYYTVLWYIILVQVMSLLTTKSLSLTGLTPSHLREVQCREKRAPPSFPEPTPSLDTSSSRMNNVSNSDPRWCLSHTCIFTKLYNGWGIWIPVTVSLRIIMLAKLISGIVSAAIS